VLHAHLRLREAPGPWFFICFGGSLPLVPVQRAANAVNAAERPLAATNARFTALD